MQATAQKQQPMHWWHRGIFYQVYPRSFQDADGDGVGDLKGIESRLDYLKNSGITAIWISPVYPSPMADFGYDISDYTGIHPLFGSMDDFDSLLSAVHDSDMKLILDLVPNHTSHLHPWFVESRSSRNNPKRNWYLWEDAGEHGVPNNWLSVFGGPAWEWDEHTQQYYYHAFLKEQPDLNWRNPEVQQAMLDVMRFWLNKGVDGFRVDVMWHMVKDALLRDNPVNPDYQPHMADYDSLLPVYSTDQPEVHDIVKKMRALLNEYDERMMIGEIYLPIHKLVTYYGTDNDGAHLPFNFMLISLPWNAKRIAAAIDEYEAALPPDAWPNWVLGNHDQPRIATRIGKEQAKIAAILLLTLRGTPTIYYGDELGMENVPMPFNEIQDPQGINMPGKDLSRDPSRTPMQWDDSAYAGFTVSKPWLRLSEDYKQVNVKAQLADPDSCLCFYRRLMRLRQDEPALQYGAYTPLCATGQIICYMRHLQTDGFIVALNLSNKPAVFEIDRIKVDAEVLISTTSTLQGKKINEKIRLKQNEGFVGRLNL
jgi:alpha-glucosidase